MNTTVTVVRAEHDITLLPVGRQGAPGRNGIDGINGTNGTDGADGVDGVDGMPGPPGPRVGEWAPSDHDLLAWAWDPSTGTAGAAVGSGQMAQVRLQLHEAAPVTGITLACMTAGAGLTVGQCLAALYTDDGTLVGVSGDQGAEWMTLGAKFVPLIGGPYNVPAGTYVAAWWANGGTPPQWLRMAGSGWIGNINRPINRYGIATGPFTNTAPPTLPGANQAMSFWAGLYTVKNLVIGGEETGR